MGAYACPQGVQRGWRCVYSMYVYCWGMHIFQTTWPISLWGLYNWTQAQNRAVANTQGPVASLIFRCFHFLLSEYSDRVNKNGLFLFLVWNVKNCHSSLGWLSIMCWCQHWSDGPIQFRLYFIHMIGSISILGRKCTWRLTFLLTCYCHLSHSVAVVYNVMFFVHITRWRGFHSIRETFGPEGIYFTLWMQLFMRIPICWHNNVSYSSWGTTQN
jgi:hypothetical protein